MLGSGVRKYFHPAESAGYERHESYKRMNIEKLKGMLCADGSVIDVKAMLDKGEAEKSDLRVWRL